MFMLVLLGSTITFFFVLAITPIINPEKFLDDRHELTPEVLSKWWDSYKHPLSVKSSITKLQSVEVNQCRSLLSSLARHSHGHCASEDLSAEVPPL